MACLVAHPAEFMPYAGIFNSSYFVGVQRIATARALFAYWRKHSRFPAPHIVGQIVFDAIARTAEEKDEDTITAYVERILTLDTNDYKEVSEHCIGWARRRALYLAIDEAAQAFQTGDIPQDGFIPLFENALKVGTNISDLGFLISPDPKESDIERIVKAYNVRNYAVPTGFPLLDAELPSGGLEPGWLMVILAPPKRYKTTFCLNLALNMCWNGRPVFYYPCEITQQNAAIRALQCLTDREVGTIKTDQHGFIKLAQEDAAYRMRAPLLIKGYPSKGATISGDIKTHAMTVQHQLGLKPGAIIIDFAETVASSADPKRTSEHRAQSQIYTDARGLAAAMNCPVIMPDRCNRETVDKTVPSMKSFQGSFEKGGIVDLAIGLCATDEEYLANAIRYFIFLSRHGEAYQHWRGNVVPKRQQMTMDLRIPWNPEQEDENRGGGGWGGGGGRRHRNRPPPDGLQDP